MIPFSMRRRSSEAKESCSTGPICLISFPNSAGDRAFVRRIGDCVTRVPAGVKDLGESFLGITLLLLGLFGFLGALVGCGKLALLRFGCCVNVLWMTETHRWFLLKVRCSGNKKGARNFRPCPILYGNRKLSCRSA